MKKKLLLGLAAMLLSWTAWAALEGSNSESPFVVTLTENGNPEKEITGPIQYAGDKTQPGIKVQFKESDTELTDLSENNYTVSYTYKTHKDAEGEGETVEGVRNAGHYTMTIKGKGGGYGYAPEQTVEFDVEPKAVDEFLRLKTGLTTTYGTDIELDNLVDKDATSFAFLAEGDEAEDFIKCLEVDKSKLNANYPNAGTYDISVKDNGVKGNNYTYTAPSGMWVTFTIEKKAVTLAVEGKDYDGVEVTVSELEATIEGLVDGDEEKVEIALSYTPEKVKNADTYELTVVASGDAADNYDIPETVNYTIARKTLQIKAKENAALSTTFTGTAIQGTDVTEQFEHEGDVTGEWDDLKLTLKWDGGTNVGEYAIKLYYDETTEVTDANKATVLDNYTIDYTAAKYEITGKSLANFTVTANNDKVIYQGKDYELVKDEESKTGVVTVKDGDTELTEGVDYQVERQAKDAEGYTEAINAGSTFTVTIKGDKNYAGTATATLTIQKRELTIALKEEVENFGKTYGDAECEDYLATYFDVTGWPKDAAGKDLEGPADIKLSMIRKAGETVAVPTGAGENGGYYVQPALDGQAKNKGQYQDASTSVFTNYYIDYEPTKEENLFKIAKKEISYWIADNKKVYDASETTPDFKVAVAEDALVGEDELDNIFVEGKAPVVTLAENVIAKNVGKYNLTLTNEDEVEAKNYALTYDNTKDNAGVEKYEITKAPATITVKAQTIGFGEYEESMLDTWKNQSNMTITGISNNYDRRDIRALIQLSLGNGAETLATGTYPEGIVIGFKEEMTETEKTLYGNYDFTDGLTNGTLTIGSKGELVLDGSIVDIEEETADEELWSVAKKLKKYNGAYVESVTVKNLKSLKNAGFKAENRWYTLVLPFDVTVREISNAFGYAIVNVPNTTNTDPDVVGFRLTMGTVPANTMMAFKVDNTMDSAEDVDIAEGVTFTNKTIVAPAEDHEWVSDLAGNSFIGVYAETVITGKNQYYLNPSTAIFMPASDQPDSSIEGGYGMVINAMNGYLEFKNPTENARILFEEADGSTTEIRAINAEKINVAEGWYTVGGVKLNAEPTEKGVYINNGKKVVIK